MSVIALGLNHTTAPLDVRGRFAFPSTELVPTLRACRDRLKSVAEVAIVSTCNRTELYLGSEGVTSDELADQALTWLAQSGDMPPADLQEHAYVFQDEGAARHAFRLAAGLSSMVVGETQILGQLKQAVREADSAGTLGLALHQLFQRSFAVAKEVRSGTDIGKHSVSLAAAIVTLAGRLFEDLQQLNVLFIGAGEMAGSVLAHIAAKAPRTLTIANRGVQRAEALARQLGATGTGLRDAIQRLAEFDLVICCTASPLPVIGLGAVQSALKARRRRPMMLVDLAVPRDIEAEVSQVGDVYLYTVDDLAKTVQAGAEKRSAAVGQAEQIIEAGVQEYRRWLATRETVPLIRALQQQVETWRAAEIQRARKLIARGEDLDVVLDALSRGITQKLLHGPMAGLQGAQGEDKVALTYTLSRLFLQCPMRRG